MIFYCVVAGAILGDIVTGLLKAWHDKKIDSTILREGLFHKAGEVLLMGLSIGGEYAAEVADLGFTIPLSTFVGSYIILMELVSILENIIDINPELSSFIKPYLNKYKDIKKDKEHGGENDKD